MLRLLTSMPLSAAFAVFIFSPYAASFASRAPGTSPEGLLAFFQSPVAPRAKESSLSSKPAPSPGMNSGSLRRW
jgi:hypothetical protein